MAAHPPSARLISGNPSSPLRAGLPLAVCCRCSLLRDETRASVEAERWVTQHSYWKTYGIDLQRCLLTYTYCPRCAQVRDSTRASAVMDGLAVANKLSADLGRDGVSDRGKDTESLCTHHLQQ
jgi:hypothetical protein